MLMASLSKVDPDGVFDGKADSDTLLDHVDFLRIDASRRLDQAHRAEMVQFFTPPPVARLMASMLAERPKKLTIIDPGAGVGSLFAALIDEVSRWGNQKPLSISLAAYEIEPLLVDYLHSAIEEMAGVCRDEGIFC